MAKQLLGKEVTAALNEKIKANVAELEAKGVKPTLGIIRVGEREDDLSYERGATKRCETLGVAFEKFLLPADVTQEELMATIDKVNKDDSIHGVLIFRPLPKHLDQAVIENALAPEKDVDCMTDLSMSGVFTGKKIGFPPCTPQACMEILDHYGIDCTGKKAVVIGRSLVVGKPAAMMLVKKNATVPICHTKTVDMPSVAKEADIVNKDQKVVSVEKNTMVNASETESTTAAKEDQGTDSQWNLKSIHVDKAKDTATDEKVKVALLDSGIDYQEGLNVKERVNLIEDDNEFSPMFEDSSNHGTSIASLIVSNNGKVKGINKNVELYSARILDENKQAPISRVVEGIYWAIDKKVNIISISFGTNQYSEALKQAIDEANAKGILVIAAAGNQGENGTDNVEYPAAFENVVAVGSVDSKAEVSDFSSTGKEVDVVAPGEAVRATGAFGETMVTSGTSMAVPHVVGAASLLWQKDTSKSKDFIKKNLKPEKKLLKS